ncbi:30S ribosomal protein [Dirofilaria immitis]
MLSNRLGEVCIWKTCDIVTEVTCKFFQSTVIIDDLPNTVIHLRINDNCNVLSSSTPISFLKKLLPEYVQYYNT